MKQKNSPKRITGKEISISLFGEILECNFCLVAFEAGEDNVPVHSMNLSIQNSNQDNKITEIVAQNM
jgi:hypothetical protein